MYLYQYDNNFDVFLYHKEQHIPSLSETLMTALDWTRILTTFNFPSWLEKLSGVTPNQPSTQQKSTYKFVSDHYLKHKHIPF